MCHLLLLWRCCCCFVGAKARFGVIFAAVVVVVSLFLVEGGAERLFIVRRGSDHTNSTLDVNGYAAMCVVVAVV